MNRYAYKGAQAGSSVNGHMEAPTPEAVALRLVESGITPISINLDAAADKSSDFDIRSLLPRQRVSLEELTLFCRQMYSLSKAGIPIIRAFRGLTESTQNVTLARAIGTIVEDLESGHSLARALSNHKDLFSDLFVSVVHVGENSGRLEESFAQMSKYLELERETIKRIKSATRYPTFVIVAMLIGMLIINMFVVPAFSGVFENLGAELPWQTQALIAISDFLLKFWPLLLLACSGAAIGVRAWVKTPHGRLLWDRYKLQLPIVGSLFERINLARFCRSFAMMLKSGVPLVQGLHIVSHALGNEYMGQKVRNMRAGIERGESFLRAARESVLFTPLVIQMIAVGEETGSVDALLEEAAEFYEEEVDYQLKTLADAIEPILIMGIGGMILVLALGVFLPLWDLSSAAS